MKKLMIAIVVAACAVAVDAASFKWSSTGTNAAKTFYGSDGTSTIPSAMVYLFEVNTVSQTALLTALRGGTSISSYSTVASQTLDANSRLASTAVTYGEAPNSYSFYMAIVDDDYVFLSSSVSSTAQASSESSINFSGIRTATQTVFSDASTAFGNAGWYSTASVPEPTSGLLLVLGLCGLALKRKRA